MKRFFLVLVALALLPPPAACQTGSATITVVDRSRVQVIVTPATYTGEPGDTVTFTAVAIDSISGDTISGVLRWSSEDTTAVQIDPTTGQATLLRAGTWQVFADLMQLVGLVITRQQDDGSYREAPTLSLRLGEVAQLCAYVYDDQGNYYRCQNCLWESTNPEVASVTTGGGNICPLWSPGMPFPEPARPEIYDMEVLRNLGVRVGE